MAFPLVQNKQIKIHRAAVRCKGDDDFMREFLSEFLFSSGVAVDESYT